MSSLVLPKLGNWPLDFAVLGPALTKSMPNHSVFASVSLSQGFNYYFSFENKCDVFDVHLKEQYESIATSGDYRERNLKKDETASLLDSSMQYN